MSSQDDDHASRNGSNIDDQLEEVYQKFEDAWELQPFPNFVDFISQVPEQLRDQVLGELIPIDLEHRWKADLPSSESDPLPANPRLSDYQALLSGGDCGSSALPDLIVAEFQVRTKWGDHPDLAAYLAQFPDQQSAIRSQCEDIANEAARQELTPGHPKFLEDDSKRQKTDRFRNTGAESQDGDAKSPEESFQSLEPNMRIGDYFLRKKLGEGGFGIVFLAEHCDRPDSSCALKFVRPNRVSNKAMVDRFQQEIRVLSRLPSHPNVVSLIDSQEWRGVAWLAMEFIQGIPLDRLVTETSQLNIPDACEILRQATVGLGHLQDNNVTHRDLKPDNLLLTSEGSVKILDLGMARLMELDDSSVRLTPSGTGLGTPNYMAPEQWQDAKHVGIQADIYSLGCTLYSLLSGRPPFSSIGKNKALSLMAAHANAPVPDISILRPDVEPDLQALIRMCMAKKPEDRPKLTSELEALLQPFCRDADLPELLRQCTDKRRFNEAYSTEGSLSGQKSSPTNRIPRLDSGTASQPDPDSDESKIESAGAASPRDEIAAYAQAPLSSEGKTPLMPDSNLGFDIPSYEATLTQHGEELERTHADVTFKPRGSSAPGIGGSGSGSFGAGLSSVSLRRRDVTMGKVDSVLAAEFEIGQILGAGGMGVVHSARQSSIDRIVAVKTVKSGRRSQESHEKFLAEAVITGILEHPNIVPIYDLGANSKDEPFYAMKEVRGKPWRKTIDEFSIDDNIEVLMKVADAIAFAHSRGIVHRDLKPDNVMIGEFGEVLVMDWGLALPTPDFAKPDIPISLGPAGTPSYMAPEMAAGPWELLGPTCDVYLMGALLFRFAAGRNPHSGANQYAAMEAARNNLIAWPSDEDNVDRELIGIARIAMSTKPEDRYASVLDFQSAVLEYRSHCESRLLVAAAGDELTTAENSQNYRKFERAIASLEQALKLWESNTHATELLRESRKRYASVALIRGDFDLSESQLDHDDPIHQPLLRQVHAARADREAQTQRVQRLRRTAAGLVAAMLAGAIVSAVTINIARVSEAEAKTDAVQRFVESQTAIGELASLAEALRDYPLAQAERRKLLDAVVQYYERQIDEVSKVPSLRLEQLRSLVRLGEIQNQLADYGSAIENWNRAEALAEQLVALPEIEDSSHLLSAEINLGLSRSLSAREQHKEAIARSSAAISILTTQLSKNDSSRVRESLGFALIQRAEIKERTGQHQTLEEDISQAISHFQKLQSPRGIIGQASARSLLARVQESRGEYAIAEESVNGAINAWFSLVDLQPSKVDYIDGLSTSQIDRTNVLRAAGHDSLDAYSEVIASLSHLVELRPGIPRYRSNLGTAWTGLAWSQNRIGLTEAAQESATEAIYIFEFLGGEYPEDQRFLYGAVSAGLTIAEILKDRGKTDQAADTLLALEELLASGTVPQDSLETKERMGELLLLRGLTESITEDGLGAKPLLAQAVDIFLTLSESKSGLPRHRDSAAWGLFFLGHDAAKAGDVHAAAEAGRQAMEIRNDLPEQAAWLDSHAWLLMFPPADDGNDLQDANEMARRKAAFAVELADGNPRFYRTLALASLRLGLLAEAVSSLELAERLTPAELPNHPEQLFLQAMLAAKQETPEQAAAVFNAAERFMIEGFSGNVRLQLLRGEAEAACRPVVPIGKEPSTLPNAPLN